MESRNKPSEIVEKTNFPTNKKILLITHSLFHEGAPYSLYFLARGLKSLGYNVTILSPSDGPLKYKYSNEKINVIIESSFWSIPKKKISFFEKFDLIYVNTIQNFSLIELIKKAKKPIIWCIRESDREMFFMKFGINKSHFQMVDKIVFVSNATRKIYSDLELKNNFVTIHNGLDINEIDSFKKTNQKNALRKKYGYSTEDIIITIVGTVIKRKGQVVFAKAAVRLLKSKQSNLHFLIIGVHPFNIRSKIKKFLKRRPDYLKNVKKIISPSIFKKFLNNNNFSNKIQLIPMTSKVYEYYLISDIFVCTSFSESFPRVILEAMAFQLPIISTNVFGILEQIDDGKHGILIPPGDSNLLADKILFLINNPEESKKYAINAFEKVKKDFTNEKMINSYDILIKQLFNKGGTAF